ncbi:MAG: galactose-1-phosphate uridylyltransferase [Actinomycetota bacterium]|nr:galactose-1-phosphate uridylyltransferase [Actinomycetota bacterium]
MSASDDGAEDMELRVDALTGAQVQIAGSRQLRPNLPNEACPFCVGGTEAPEPYDTKAFVNRWPSFAADRGEVVLYSPRHGETLASLGPGQTRKVIDLWADRTAALGARDDVAYVLVFENHGPEVGATISHPHGQIFGFPDVPPSPARELARLADGHRVLEDDPAELRVVVERDGWRAWVPHASVHPYGMRIAPLDQRPDLPALTEDERDGLASMLVDVLGRLDRMFGVAQPYMFWFHQRPTDGGRWPQAWLHLEIAAPWRAPGVMRFIAGGELGSGVFINPVRPEAAAEALRQA